MDRTIWWSVAYLSLSKVNSTRLHVSGFLYQRQLFGVKMPFGICDKVVNTSGLAAVTPQLKLKDLL
nr:hypothetical protein OAM_20285 [Vibrio cyclitrophicus ZF14]PMG85348.1 hypothetical protein BCU82_16610 [Vibrio cyclitrophicus]PMJ21894.1 hypothetical protein BCU28_09225 [Vibrio cyclitrophicus]PMP55942.1 hypothetical protein BCS84_11055 [Vibrio cyclitrophicus]|tara:strand:- start:6040 stop:6237 length:198 start_codon:yes stop_codon:yes gene_type:complete